MMSIGSCWLVKVYKQAAVVYKFGNCLYIDQ